MTSVVSAPKVPKFRYSAKSIFLTFAQCPLSKEVMMEHIKLQGQLDKCCIAQEAHADGHMHLHVAAWYKNRLEFKSPQRFDIQGYHPNIRHNQIQFKLKTLKYLNKEDAEPLQFNMDIQAETAARTGHKKLLGKRLLDGEDLIDVVNEHPELIFEYKKLKCNVEEFRLD